MPETLVRKNNGAMVAFGDVVRHVKDKIETRDPKLERFVAGEHMDTDDLRIRRWGVIGEGYLGPAFHMRFRPGQVLYGSRRTYLRKVAVADFEGVTANTTYVLEPKDATVLLPELLPFLMQTDGFNQHSVRESKGSVNPYVNFSDLARYEFTLPAIDEQRRLVRVLQSVDEVRETARGLQEEADATLTSALHAITTRCSLRPVATLVADGTIEQPQDGNHGEKHPQASDYVESGIPFVMAADLKAGEVDVKSCKKLRKEQAESLRIGFAREGDVLLSHKGTVGSVARLRGLSTGFAMLTPQVTYYRVRNTQALHADWLFFMFQAPAFQRQLLQYGRQSTRAYVGISEQQNLEIPYCVFSQQQQYLQVLRGIERAITETRARRTDAERLRQRLVSAGMPQ